MSWRKTQSNIRTAVIIPAGGLGRRMRKTRPKQFLELSGRPVICHTLEIFESCGSVETIHLVVPPGMEEFCREEIVKKSGFKKVSLVVTGGETRQESVFRGLTSLSQEFKRIVIHDAVRPFLTPELLEEALLQCREDVDGVVVAVPCKDTPKQVEADGMIASTLKREGLFLAQTPQVFWSDILKKAFDRAKTDGFQGTDDSAVVERIGGKIRVVLGNSENIKITTPEDYDQAQEFLRIKSSSEV